MSNAWVWSDLPLKPVFRYVYVCVREREEVRDLLSVLWRAWTARTSKRTSNDKIRHWPNPLPLPCWFTHQHPCLLNHHRSQVLFSSNKIIHIISYPLQWKDYLICVQWQESKQWSVCVTTATRDHNHEESTEPDTELCQATKSYMSEMHWFPKY